MNLKKAHLHIKHSTLVKLGLCYHYKVHHLSLQHKYNYSGLYSRHLSAYAFHQKFIWVALIIIQGRKIFNSEWWESCLGELGWTSTSSRTIIITNCWLLSLNRCASHCVSLIQLWFSRSLVLCGHDSFGTFLFASPSRSAAKRRWVGKGRRWFKVMRGVKHH